MLFLLAAASGLFATGAAVGRSSVSPDDQTVLRLFDENFAVRFVSEDVVGPIVRGVLEETPDGLETYADVRASLLWQVRSFGGFAEFFSGDRSITVEVSFEDDAVNLEWGEGPSLIPRLFADIGFEGDEAEILRVSSELNQSGAAQLDANNHLVRGADGGIQVVGS